MNQGIDLHLPPAEQAFYDALDKPELIKIHYESQVLREEAYRAD